MSSGRLRGSVLAGCGALLLSAVVPAVASSTSRRAERIAPPRVHVRHTLAIKTLSVRADLVSGGEVLTRVLLPGDYNVKPSNLHLQLNGHDVDRWFARRPDHQVEGLVRDLRLGANHLVAWLAGQRAELTITNHPVGGPVFAGPQVKPWKCQAGATDAQCDQKPSYSYQYLPAGTNSVGVGVTGVASVGAFRPYDPSSPPPAQLIATTTTKTGVTVPFIVRQETGYIDRDQYTIAALWQPGKAWHPWAPQPQFNRRLVITHGASCDTTYGTGAAPGVLDPDLIGAGFILMSNALDNAGHNCNLLTQAESLVMTKQRVIDKYGPVLWTIGTGCSGGSLVQQQVANAYPGIYQGITPQCSFTDAWSSALEYVDYTILLKYFEDPSKWGTGVAWTPLGISQALDHPNVGNPVTFTNVIPNSANPSRSCPDVPASRVYQPGTNPHGVKCTLQQYMVNVFGLRKDGFANRPFGNDGIQYGLQGLLNGEISPADFVDLNAKIGGLTQDDTYQKARSKPDLIGLKRAYRSGAVDSANNLNRVAIIDLRGPDPGAFHDVYRTYAMRARLLRDFGTAANQVLWRGLAPLIGDVSYADSAVLAMDGWLARVHADHRSIPLPRKIIADKPVSLTERCTDGATVDIPAEACDEAVQAYGTPRMSAGMPMTDDILECRLRPLSRTAYPVQFTDAQWQELKETFPQGVCNYGVRGVDQRGAIAWLTYQRANGKVIYGGKPLGPEPRSTLAREEFRDPPASGPAY
ncbi:MAG TPA: DUF6351 family protein [Mycobacteriales bacterium]|nr:DUF6351 family protein [Mycobacteriales bacterium]